MRVAVLGDLHVGTPRVPGAFGHTPSVFERWLHALLDTHDRVVLNGDIVQCDHVLRPGRTAQVQALRAALAHHDWLDHILAHPRVVALHGNHDAIAHSELSWPTSAVFSGRTSRVVITHGDAFDPVIGRAPRVSAVATWCTGRLRAVGLGHLAEPLEQRDIAIKARRFQHGSGPYAAAAERLAAENSACFVVFGHTHVRCDLTLDDARLLNPGSASRGRTTAVSVDLDSGTARFLGH